MANSVIEITLNPELESELDFEEEEEMHSMFFHIIEHRPPQKIWKGAGRRGGYADGRKRSGTFHMDDIETLGTSVQILQAVGKEDFHWQGLS